MWQPAGSPKFPPVAMLLCCLFCRNPGNSGDSHVAGLNLGCFSEHWLKQLCNFGKLVAIVSFSVSLVVPKADGEDPVGFVFGNQRDLIYKSCLLLQDWDRLVLDDSV